MNSNNASSGGWIHIGEVAHDCLEEVLRKSYGDTFSKEEFGKLYNSMVTEKTKANPSKEHRLSCLTQFRLFMTERAVNHRR